ncbi:hypothetical protein OH492_15690 [Vibrio chagasii]|nr:hypothetical protein [Vibrio chagasii]
MTKSVNVEIIDYQALCNRCVWSKEFLQMANSLDSESETWFSSRLRLSLMATYQFHRVINEESKADII